MVKKLKGRKWRQNPLLPLEEMDIEAWQADMELMSLVEEAAELEASLRNTCVRERCTHAPQWGRETEERLRSRLWVILNMLEMEGRYGQAIEFARQQQRRGVAL